MNAHKYATALEQALEGKTKAEQGKITTQFLQRIKEKRHQKALPRIVRLLKRGTTINTKEFLIVGKRKDVAKARKEARTKVGAIVDSNLVGGWQHYKEGILTDTSYKRSLIDLYRNITK